MTSVRSRPSWPSMTRPPTGARKRRRSTPKIIDAAPCAGWRVSGPDGADRATVRATRGDGPRRRRRAHQPVPAQRASCGDASGGACGGTAGRDGERRRRGTERRGSCGGSETHGTGLRGQDRAPGPGDEGAAYDDAGAEADGRGLRSGGEPRLSTAGLEALRINGAELLRGEDIVAEIARAKGDGCTPRRLTDALAEARGAAAPLTLFSRRTRRGQRSGRRTTSSS